MTGAHSINTTLFYSWKRSLVRSFLRLLRGHRSAVSCLAASTGFFVIPVISSTSNSCVIHSQEFGCYVPVKSQRLWDGLEWPVAVAVASDAECSARFFIICFRCPISGYMTRGSGELMDYMPSSKRSHGGYLIHLQVGIPTPVVLRARECEQCDTAATCSSNVRIWTVK
jgi:hypothetical protein